MIKIIVDGQSLRWYDRAPKVAADSVEFVKFKFLLSEEWDDHVVVAQFSQKGATYNKVLEEGCCTLPVEIKDGKCFISVFGQIPGGPERATVIPLLTDVSLSGFVGNGETPIPPTPDLYSQLIDYFSKNSSGGAGAVDPEDIAQAVEDYLTEHPIEESYSTTTEITDESTNKEVPTAAAVRTYVSQHFGSSTEPFIVTVRKSTSGTTADKTSKEVYEAYTQGKIPYCHLIDVVADLVLDMPFTGGGDVLCYFANTIGGLNYFVSIQDATAAVTVTELLASDKLTEAVEDALTQAKESGEFDGDDYVLTEDDKLEIAEQVSKLSGGNVDQVSVEPAEDDMPKVFITGVKPTTKDDVLAEMEYDSKTDKFHAYLTIKCQGTSSMMYAKKNFTIKLFSDEARETKLKKDFKDWNHPSNKFVLKANWIDHSHARNVVSAKLWGEVVQSRPDYYSLPVEMRNAPNNGAVDGFPIKVYYNNNYEGVYTWNIGKDDWMWGMDEDNANHVLLCAEGNTNGVYAETTSNFRKLWDGVDGSNPGWSVEVGTNSTAVKTSLNNLIQFVMDNDGDDFRNGIGNYLDIQSAIDYYIFQYEICGLDGLAHNMLLATYDGVVWRCGAYDLDATFGLWWNGGSFVSATFACPEDYQERYSLLWERIEANFLPELKARQAELRKTVLSYSNMVTHFERFMDIIGLDLYAEDLTVYSAIPSGSTNNIKQIRNYIRDRQAYVDSEFAAMSEPIPCTGITLSASELTFTAEGSQTLTATVTPDGCTDKVTWVSDNTSVATVADGVVTAVANGSATITAYCGEYSASCSVAVSGMTEVVACTGITLDHTELTFDGEGTQTITATVTPSDTTDTVVWVSSAPAVASISVEGNVCTVQSVSNGSAEITVTCGEHSAICSVSVGGIAVDPLLTAVWSVGGIDSSTGEEIASSIQRRTNAIDISAYTNRIFNMTFTGGSNWAMFYNENNEYIGSSDKVIPNNAKYVRFVVGSSTGTFTVNVARENLWDTLEIRDGGYPNGTFNQSSTFKHIRIAYSSEETLHSYYAWGVTYLDVNENKLGFKNNSKGTVVTFSAPDNTAYIDLSTDAVDLQNCTCGYLGRFGSCTLS